MGDRHQRAGRADLTSGSPRRQPSTNSAASASGSEGLGMCHTVQPQVWTLNVIVFETDPLDTVTVPDPGFTV